MKKIVRLTESDLVRIVKRVVTESKNTQIINEIFQSPWGAVAGDLYDRGFTVINSNKNLTSFNEPGDDDIYFVGKNGKWRRTTIDIVMNNDLDLARNPNSKVYTPVTNQSLISKLNSVPPVKGEKYKTIFQDLIEDPSAKNIANFIYSSKNIINDREANAEASFMAIDTKQKYNEVKRIMRQDPYEFVKSFMDTSKVYHKKSIDSSMKRLGLL